MIVVEPEGSTRALLAQAINAAGDRVGGSIVSLVADTLGLSRQTVQRHLSDMVSEGLVDAAGRTRGRTYRLKVTDKFERSYSISSRPEEHVVWRECFAEPLSALPRNIYDICLYGLTEMFNNAIEHSLGESVTVSGESTLAKITLEVKDDGIGVFRKIREGLNLADDREAIPELSKGKVTTDSSKHTGKGIFFTSRVFDEFVLSANNLSLVHLAPDDKDDWLIQHDNDFPGTLVRMSSSVWSHRTSAEVFAKYASGEDEPNFGRTHVPLRLFLVGEENLVSRSQARRVLARVEKFKEAMLDFEGITNIGQAFADEIFRVFANEHPDIKIILLAMNPRVKEMVDRAKSA
jgi:anti-sigma regulatory factor (Ser/Thr protein kinase)